MDAAVAKAAVDVAHAAGKPAFAHPQNKAGVDAVVAAGVDVMAHTIPSETGYTSDQLAGFKSQGTALTPTLSLWTTGIGGPEYIARRVQSGVNQLKAFSDNGGVVLFGTDIGYIKIYDTSLEYELMHRALSAPQVLASLTTNPARYFKAATKGKVEKGFDADLVVLDGDPMTDVRNLTKVTATIRAGKVIYQRP
jgi:imidazolonepropionase-like amidohydrolase